jgi:Cu+-exporting ATPase
VGVTATLDGHEVAVGKPGANGSSSDSDGGRDARPPGALTTVHVSRDGQLIGAIQLEDSVRETARETVAQLKAMRLRPVLLTGDHRVAAQSVAAALGIEDVEAEVTPDGKSERIRARQAAGHHVIMVGDGINDAPALAVADVGIALAGGTEVAGETAHITLVGDRLDLLPAAVALARRSTRIIKQNLFWAFFYNVIAIPLAALAILPAAYAAAAMMFSSISVVLNSLRLQRSPGTSISKP